MNKKLIVVADDFGFSEAYNLGVVKAYKEGIVSTISMMVNMEAADHGVKLLEGIDSKNIVVHTNLVHGRPVSNPKDIPSLVDEDGNFYRSYKWKSDKPNDTKCVGDIVPTKEHCKKETMAQLEKFKSYFGHYPIHFEGHSVGGRNVMAAFKEISEELGIHSMGMDEVESEIMYPAHELLFDNPDAMKKLFIGTEYKDFVNDEFKVLDSKYDINILHFHPGYVDGYILDNSSLTIARCRDLQTLCDERVKRWITDNNIELVNFESVYK